ncbi:MAG: hypothetical protein E6G97_25895 [Alphaproteobacteria bacterium]|nr:MAG: hypothetical protein E6G97_25895 [Alphaproteobacteria bacterium]
MSNYQTQRVGARIYVIREPHEIIGWLDREYEQPASVVRGGIYMPQRWTGRYIAHVCCDADNKPPPVTSPAEGLLLIARVTELHDASVLGPLFI